MMRLRLTFSKTEAMRYTGHLDLHRAWERTFRRARLPLAYSQGFHPQPRFSLACALPLGYTSECELIDIWLEQEMTLAEIQAALIPALPPGIQIESYAAAELNAPALQTQVQSAHYGLTFLEPVAGLAQAIADLLAAEKLPRERRGKPYDLRPLIEAAEQIAPDEEGHARVHLQLAARENATGRPDEVLNAMQIAIEIVRVHRTGLVIAQKG